jgi:hypothetical protein
MKPPASRSPFKSPALQKQQKRTPVALHVFVALGAKLMFYGISASKAQAEATAAFYLPRYAEWPTTTAPLSPPAGVALCADDDLWARCIDYGQ